MRVVEPNAALRDLLARYDAAGGVVDHVLVAAPEGGSPPQVTHHQQAAVAALEALRSRREAPPSTWRLQIRGEPSMPHSVTVTEFLGPYYDLSARRLVHSHSDGVKQGADEFTTHGYADAFADPPYSLRLDFQQTSALFDSITDALFGGLTPDLDIQKWSTDWANYFDPGLDWWGAFLWTVFSPKRRHIVVVAAASTD